MVEVQLLKYGRVQNFDQNNLALQKGDRVLVESEQGVSFGVVCSDPRPFSASENRPERLLGLPVSRTWKDSGRTLNWKERFTRSAT
jgi:cell fate regulator YaaT (PSP1 superfamily)